MGFGKSGALLATVGMLVAVGCGKDHPPAEVEVYHPPTTPAQTTIAGNDGGSGNAPPGCGTAADGTQCGCVDTPLFDNPPNIYFLLDHSGSMAEDDKWDQVRETVANVMRALGPRANFGAMLFPGPSQQDQCAPPVEVLPVTQGDPPSASANGPAVSKLIAGTSISPNGGTPTAAAIGVVQQRVATVNGKTFVVVATDGAPNCNLQASCDASQCQLNIDFYGTCTPTGTNCCTGDDIGNCNDGDATVAAIQSLKNAGFPVYVVGLPGSGGPYATLLDNMAVAGGTAQPTEPKYFAVSSASQDVILATFKKIAAQITGTCTFELKAAPQDPGLVNVYLDNNVLPFEPTNGWTISDKTITLEGTACANVKDGNVLDVRIITGCPTVLPK